jgi:hypothetical protein
MLNDKRTVHPSFFDGGNMDETKNIKKPEKKKKGPVVLPTREERLHAAWSFWANYVDDVNTYYAIKERWGL